jgi:uncharacterized protein YqhQ
MENQQPETKRLGWSYGGQAVMEGVMMRGAHLSAVAVRRPDGEIAVKTEPVSQLYRGPVSRIPFLRGIPMLWDSLGLGMRALFYSAEVVGQAEDPDFKMSGGLGIGTGALSLLAGMALFMLLPSWVAGLLVRAADQTVLFNIVEGLIRLAILIGYMAAVGQMAEIRRVFAYHGAEHKTVNAHEAGAPLTVESVRTFSTAHTRCGTAFLLIVVVISILVFAPLGKPPLLIRLASRLLLLPVITGIAYEVLRFTGKHNHWGWVRVLIAPNLALQRLTTREPDDAMLEVAITALKTVLAGEETLTH